MTQKEFARTTSINGVGIINLMGDVTPFSEKEVMDIYEQLTRENYGNILLNFAEAAYINSGGIAIIISIVTEGRKKNQTIAVCSLTPHFQKIFDMIGLTEYVTLHPTQDAALSSMK
ncbi:MAG: STAS domain-containing protein [Ignavibacteriales bacterium]|nr:STAS domain-containing protein [Ignavibacteriales bacterium]